MYVVNNNKPISLLQEKNLYNLFFLNFNKYTKISSGQVGNTESFGGSSLAFISVFEKSYLVDKKAIFFCIGPPVAFSSSFWETFATFLF